MSRRHASRVAAEKRAKGVEEGMDKLSAAGELMEGGWGSEGGGVGSNGAIAGRKSKTCGPGSVMALVAERDHALHRELDTQVALNKTRVERAQKDAELSRYPLPYTCPCTVVYLCDVRSADPPCACDVPICCLTAARLQAQADAGAGGTRSSRRTGALQHALARAEAAGVGS